jgi:arylsulfatase A-like enzyme
MLDRLSRRGATLLCVLATLSCSEREAELQATRERPNVILIVIDTLRQDHLGSYGHTRRTSPRIDAFAAESMRYSRAYTQAPWTTPAIGSLLASQYPTTLGIRNERSILSEDLVLLPELLAQHGFVTGAVVGHDFCSSKFNFDQGFEEFDESQILGLEGISSPEITRRGLEFAKRHREQPFFLWLHYFDPHWSYRTHPEFEFDADNVYQGRATDVELMFELLQMSEELAPEDVAELERRYDTELAFTDHHVGVFLDGLRELALFDDSLIILVADHGEEFKDHGRVGHAHSLYGELIDIPMIVHFPNGEPAVSHRPVATVDIYPTVLEVLDLEPSSPLVGRPLPRSGGSGAGDQRIVFSETMRFANLRAAIAGRWKLVKDLETGQHQLFDLELDPDERHDLYAERGSEHEALVKRLDRWIAEAAATARVADEIELSPDEIESLRALGYGD